MTTQTAQRRIKNIPAAIKATRESLKEILMMNAKNNEEWNNQRCIDAHEGQVNFYKKQLKEAREVLA